MENTTIEKAPEQGTHERLGAILQSPQSKENLADLLLEVDQIFERIGHKM